MADKKIYEQRLADLIHNKAEELRDQEFRLALEEIIKEPEEDIGHILVPFLSDQSINAEIRNNIIRAAGYLQHPLYLIPLKNIIENEANIRIKQEAIISVAKYNDRRALNILNNALQNLNNPLLARTINSEIHRIKQNNPILGLLPRFMEGSKNPKTFKITLDILKRILTSADVSLFSKYLDSPDPMVQQGAFEILCTSGDVFHDNFILDFFYKQVDQIACTGEKECDELYYLVLPFHQFLVRYQFLIEEQVPKLIRQFEEIDDIRVQSLYISIICKSQQSDSIEFMDSVYEIEENLQKEIVTAFSGNEQAVDFLHQKYEQDPDVREVAIQSLLNTRWGLDHFTDNFFDLEFEVQEMVLLQLPYSKGYDLVDFIREVFEANVFRLKEICLTKVKENFEFSVQDILFSPEHEREFLFMGDHYLDTLTRLFPVAATKHFFRKIAEDKLSVTKTKKFLSKLEQIVPFELLFTIRDREFITNLFERIIMSNNKELNLLFLGILKFIKTLDAETYRILGESLNLFITKREKNITSEERGELERTKKSLRDLFYEIKRIEDGSAEIRKLFANKETDFDLLRNILKQYHISVVMNIDYFTKELTAQFNESNRDILPEWLRIFKEYPRIAHLLEGEVEKASQLTTGRTSRELQELHGELGDNPLRLVINFKNRRMTAFLREQFMETAPHIPFVSDIEDPAEEDVLLCDVDALSDLTLQGKTIPKKIYLFLEKAEGFAAFRAFNPRSFVAPFSFYRITREILQHLYI